jgi:hypothetical protein
MNRKLSEIQMVKLSDLKVNEEFAPKADPVFVHLLTEAVRGRQPVHFAIIAFKLLKRFDDDHRPELSVSGKNILEQVIETWPKGQTNPIWVYQSGDEFISSDDYFTFAAYEQKKVDQVSCFVFGTPEGKGVTDIQGPLTVEQIKKSLGFS